MFATIRTGLQAHRFKVLLCGLLLVIALAPFLADDQQFGDGVVAVGLGLPFFAAFVAGGIRTRRQRVVAAVLAIATVATSGSVASGMLSATQSGALVANLAFLAFTTVVVFGGVFRSRRVTGDVLAGAVAGYILLAFTWAAAFGVVEAVHRHSFAATSSAVPTVQSYNDLVYFAFIALMSIGFGDIAPVTEPARALVICAGISGVAFNTIVLALLVSKYLAHSERFPG
jgi:hypothetical protein